MKAGQISEQGKSQRSRLEEVPQWCDEGLNAGSATS